MKVQKQFIILFLIITLVSILISACKTEEGLPTSCTLAPGIACTDFSVFPDSITLNIRYENSSYQIKEISIESCSEVKFNQRTGNNQFIEFLNCNNGEVDSRIIKNINMRYKGYDYSIKTPTIFKEDIMHVGAVVGSTGYSSDGQRLV